jgi:hypothetical protein
VETGRVTIFATAIGNDRGNYFSPGLSRKKNGATLTGGAIHKQSDFKNIKTAKVIE